MRRTAFGITLILAVGLLLAVSSQDDRDLGQRAVTVDFAGGTVAEYVAALREKSPATNVVIRPAARDLRVEPVALTNVSMRSALYLLDGEHQSLEDRFEINVTDSGGGSGSQIFVIDAKSAALFAGHAPARVQVFAIDDLVRGDVSEEDLLTVIETALEMLGTHDDDPQFNLRFHDATGILIARATADQLNTIEQVLSQLREAASRRQASQAEEFEQHRFQMLYEDARERAALLEHRLHEVETEAVTSRTQLELVNEENVKLRERAENLTDEVRRMEQRAMQLEMSHAQVQSELRAAQQRNDGGG